MDTEEFSKAWNNVIFVVAGPKQGEPAGFEMEKIMSKGQRARTFIRINDRVLDTFIMDSTTPAFSGGYPWW
jgi:hypothetical protein